nr:ABC transporter permease [Desulfobacterales bacterium]
MGNGHLKNDIIVYRNKERRPLHNGWPPLSSLSFTDRGICALGRRTIDSLNHILDLFAFACKISSLLLMRNREGRSIVYHITIQQIYFTAVQALPIIFFISLIIGSMIVIQFSKQFGTVEGNYILGNLVVFLIVRELGPLITAIIVILRTAVAVTIEIGYMNVLHEMEAIEMMGIDPLYTVCLPRLIGITTAILCLFVIFDVVALIGGYLISWTFTDIPMEYFLPQIGKAITGTDLAVGIIKGLFFGYIITTVCLYQGFRIKNSITEIPPGTSRAAVECLLYCLFVNITISVIFYL